MKTHTQYPVIEVPASGKRTWIGGAYTLAFVYSKRGNFLIKGYYDEVKDYVKKNFTHYFVNYSLRHDKSKYGGHRDIWDFWKKEIGIFAPDHDKSMSKYRNIHKWQVKEYGYLTPDEEKKMGINKPSFEFKRLPKRWIPDFDKF